MRFIHILRCPIEQIKTNEHARNRSALPALSGVEWASRVLTSASTRSRTFHCARPSSRVDAQPPYLVKNKPMNRLYFGDNLKWLSDRKEFPDASVDLVYR